MGTERKSGGDNWNRKERNSTERRENSLIGQRTTSLNISQKKGTIRVEYQHHYVHPEQDYGSSDLVNLRIYK